MPKKKKKAKFVDPNSREQKLLDQLVDNLDYEGNEPNPRNKAEVKEAEVREKQRQEKIEQINKKLNAVEERRNGKRSASASGPKVDDKKIVEDMTRKADIELWYDSLGPALQQHGIDINNPFAMADILIHKDEEVQFPSSEDSADRDREFIQKMENMQSYAFMEMNPDGTYKDPRPRGIESNSAKWMTDNLKTFQEAGKDFAIKERLYEAAQKNLLHIRSDTGTMGAPVFITVSKSNKANISMQVQEYNLQPEGKPAIGLDPSVSGLTKEQVFAMKKVSDKIVENRMKLDAAAWQLKGKLQPQVKEKDEQLKIADKERLEAVKEQAKIQKDRLSTELKKDKLERERKQFLKKNEDTPEKKQEYENQLKEINDKLKEYSEFDRRVEEKTQKCQELAFQRDTLARQAQDCLNDKLQVKESRIAALGQNHPEWLGVNAQGQRVPPANDHKAKILEENQRKISELAALEDASNLTPAQTKLRKDNPEIANIKQLRNVEEILKKSGEFTSLEQAVKSQRVNSALGYVYQGSNTKSFMRNIMKDLQAGKAITVSGPEKDGKIATETLVLDKNGQLKRAANVTSWKERLTELQSSLTASDSRFSKKSESYEKLKESLRETIEALGKHDRKHPYISSDELRKNLKKLQKSCGEFVNDCRGKENELTGRDFNHLGVAQEIHKMMPTESKTLVTPSRSVRENLAMRLVMGRAKSLTEQDITMPDGRNSKEVGKEILLSGRGMLREQKQLMESDDFKRFINGKSNDQIAKMIKEKPDGIWKSFAEQKVKTEKKEGIEIAQKNGGKNAQKEQKKEQEKKADKKEKVQGPMAH